VVAIVKSLVDSVRTYTMAPGPTSLRGVEAQRYRQAEIHQE
jgi:hypothetical protein